ASKWPFRKKYGLFTSSATLVWIKCLTSDKCRCKTRVFYGRFTPQTGFIVAQFFVLMPGISICSERIYNEVFSVKALN
ncbi:MAG: hypothetical protein QGE94_07085, partial [Desulfobacterales bacterium]|nr:hypothetical protein [Desulfobacterales bacterium]